MTGASGTPAPPGARASPVVLVALGLVAGYLSGLFGVGGGIIVVPALLLVGFEQRRAAGTSVAAILPTSIVGATGYALTHNIDWIAGIALAVGVIVGAQIGSYLLAKLPTEALFWAFLVFLVFSIVSLWINVPSRDDDIDMSWWVAVALVGAGVLTGILSGVLGVGGGIVAVPGLMFFFGASDLIARGTSLLMMIPGSISATVGNLRRGNTDLRAAAWIGLSACATSPLGILTATAISPLWSNTAFAVLMSAVIVQLVVRHVRARRR